MSTAQNKALANRMVEEFFNQRDLTVADDILAADMVEHEELPPGMPVGREGTKAMFTMMYTAFPDFQATVENLIAEDDRVVVHMLWTGTHQGEFMGIPPTGRRMSINVIDILRVADGKFVEHWGVSDMMGLMQQLGVSPE
jgi:steroid delta-isomerase-like uncharacterized protein